MSDEFIARADSIDAAYQTLAALEEQSQWQEDWFERVLQDRSDEDEDDFILDVHLELGALADLVEELIRSRRVISEAKSRSYLERVMHFCRLRAWHSSNIQVM